MQKEGIKLQQKKDVFGFFCQLMLISLRISPWEHPPEDRAMAKSGRVLPIQVRTFAIAIEGQQQTRSHISINEVRHWDLIKPRCSCNCAMFMPTVATLFVCPAKNGTNRIEDWRLMRRDELPPLETLARGRRVGKRAN